MLVQVETCSLAFFDSIKIVYFDSKLVHFLSKLIIFVDFSRNWKKILPEFKTLLNFKVPPRHPNNRLNKLGIFYNNFFAEMVEKDYMKQGQADRYTVSYNTEFKITKSFN